jgi:signal transduction histidine kinase
MTNDKELYMRIESGRPWILLVDDDVNILDTAKDILEESGYVVMTAPTGTDAVRQLEEQQFNIVVVDFQLPDTTGLELARKVRESNDYSYVILMTGHASLDMAVNAIHEAVYDYLIKPVDPGQLQRTIARAVEKQRLTLDNKRLFDELRVMNEAMARLDTLKSKMLAVMSHDLRTPLSSIRGYSELLRSGVKGRLTEDQKRILEITMQEADNINGLIGDLLDLASVETGKLSLELRTIRIDELMQKAMPRVKLSSELKEVGVEVALSTPSARIKVDVNRMVQVLSNIMRNSLKQTPRGGRVYVSAVPKEGKIELRIAHTGSGFAPEQLKTLFNWSNKEENTSLDGLRVGLAIGREVIQAHGGDMGVESGGPDQGSAYWLTLPVEG